MTSAESSAPSFDPSLAEPSRETGIPRTAVISTEVTPGAAGTIANNLVTLGAGNVAVLGVTGDDGHGDELAEAMADVLKAQPVPAMRRHDPWWLSFDPGNSPSPDARHPSMPAPGHHWCWRHLRLPSVIWVLSPRD